MPRLSALLGVLVVLLLLRGSLLLSAVWVNAGMLVLRDGLIARADSAPGTYPVYESLDDTPATARAMQNLRRAVALDEGSLAARWALGRAALAVGDGEMAADALGPLAGRVGDNPFLYLDTLIAFSYGGRPEEVIALYESTPPLQPTQAISDAVALAYLEESRGAEEQVGKGGLERARVLRPGDLYANYFLWRESQEARDAEAAAAYSETLGHFPLEAIDPADERLLDYACEVVPALLESGLWEREKTLNVVSFLVWQHNETPGVARLLERLSECYPTEPDWLFYLAELHHRQGDLEQAGTMYQHVLAVDPQYAQAYLRLGMVAETKSQEHLEEAAGWYEQYHALAPDDLLGLKRLTEVCEALECPDAVALREELETRADGRRIVARLLDVSLDEVELGPNLVGNGGLEAWEGVNPTGWRLWFYLGPDNDSGLYVAGKDTLIPGDTTARIVTLWGGPQPDGTMTYGEYIGESFVVGDTRYLISVSYCSWRFSEGGGLVFLGDYWHANSLVLANHPLPDSSGQWRVMHLLVDGGTMPISVVPLVRNWGVGQMWIQALGIYPVVCKRRL